MPFRCNLQRYNEEEEEEEEGATMTPSIEVIAAKAEVGKMLTDAEKAALMAAEEGEETTETAAKTHNSSSGTTTAEFDDYAGDDEAQRAAVTLQALQRGRIARAEVAKLRAEGAAAELVEVGATVRVDSPLTHS